MKLPCELKFHSHLPRISTPREFVGCEQEMERVTEMRSEYFGPSAMPVAEDAHWIMEQVEAFLIELGASIVEREERGISAELD